MPSAAALRAMEKFEANMKKSWGEGIIQSPASMYTTISTGSIALDRAMGAGGYVKGRCTEIWGPNAGGKTSLAMIAAGNAQKQFEDEFVALIDVEHTYDSVWAKKLGVDTDYLKVVDPTTAEDVADLEKDLLTSGLYSLIIVDSLGAMLAKDEFEKDAGDSAMGKRAQVQTRMVNIAAAYAKKYGTAVIFLNQVRANIGYGADTKSSGAISVGHVTSHKLNVKRSSAPYTVGSDANKHTVGYEMGVKVEKSKICPEGRNVKFDFFVEPSKKGPIGVDRIQEAFNLGVQDSLIQQSGAYYTLPDGTRLQGKDNALEDLRSKPALVEEIRTKILANVAHELIEDDGPDITPEQAERL